MKRIQWCIVGSLAVGLIALPASAQTEQGQQGQQQGQQGQQQGEQGQPQSDQEPLQGKVQMTEIGLSQTPPAVRSAIETWAEGSDVKKVHEVRQGTKIQYQAEIEREGKNLQVLINQQGQVLRAGEDIGLDTGIF